MALLSHHRLGDFNNSGVFLQVPEAEGQDQDAWLYSSGHLLPCLEGRISVPAQGLSTHVSFFIPSPQKDTSHIGWWAAQSHNCSTLRKFSILDIPARRPSHTAHITKRQCVLLVPALVKRNPVGTYQNLASYSHFLLSFPHFHVHFWIFPFFFFISPLLFCSPAFLIPLKKNSSSHLPNSAFRMSIHSSVQCHRSARFFKWAAQLWSPQMAGSSFFL